MCPRFSARRAAPASWSLQSPRVDLILRGLFPVARALMRPSRNASASSRVSNSARIFRVGRLTTMNGFKACTSWQADPSASRAPVRSQLELGNDRAEVSLHNLERLENRPLCQELAVVLRARTVVAATGILGWKTTSSGPRTAAGRPRERHLTR